MIYDNADAAAGGDGSYSFADIFAVLGGTGVDILRVDSGTGFPTYRVLKNLQIGDKTVGTASTTLQDTNVVVTFDNQRVLKTRATQPTSWSCILGTKVGSGNQASGKKGCMLFFTNTAGTNSIVLRGTNKLYGCTLQSSWSGGVQALQFPNQTTGASELVNCNFGGFSTYVLGSSGAALSNLYNVDITGDSLTSDITSFFVDSASRITVGGSPSFAYLSTATVGISFRDVVFLGSPGLSDLKWTSLANDWIMVRPQWSGAAKFDLLANGPATAATGAHEYWVWDVKVVDRNGTAIANIPAMLTDIDGNIQVNTTTDSSGQVTFGSGLTANCVVVADHYSVGGALYTIHQRGPFTAAINTGASKNSNYLSRTYLFNWPGSETVTTTAGTFEDISDVVAIEDASGVGTTWVELTL